MYRPVSQSITYQSHFHVIDKLFGVILEMSYNCVNCPTIRNRNVADCECTIFCLKLVTVTVE